MVLSRSGEGAGDAKFLLKCLALHPICLKTFVVLKVSSSIKAISSLIKVTREQCRMQRTWNRIGKGCQETVLDAGHLEQSAGSRTVNSAGCREHGTGYGKDDRELYRMQVTLNRVREGGQGTVQDTGNME